MPLTRLQFLGCLYDGNMYPMGAEERLQWQTLFHKDPLAAYMAGKEVFIAAPPRPSPGLLSLPEVLLLEVARFLGQNDSYGILANLCRAPAAYLSAAPFLDSVELKLRTFYVVDTNRPTPREMYALYWKIERSLALHGVYGVCMDLNGRRHVPPLLLTVPLFSRPEVNWKAALSDVGWIFAVVPHIRCLTIRLTSHAPVAAADEAQLPPDLKGAAMSIRNVLHYLACPNIEEFYVLDAMSPLADTWSFWDFFEHHDCSPLLRAFVAPSPSNPESRGYLGSSSGFPFLPLEALKYWQYVESYRVDKEGDISCFPKPFDVPDGVESLKAMGMSCIVDGVIVCIVSLGMPEWVSLTTTVEPPSDFMPRMCRFPQLETHFRCTMRGRSHEFTRTGCDGDRGPARRQMAEALMDICQHAPNVEVRVQAWSPVDSRCEHHKVLDRLATYQGDRLMSWMAKGCSCNLSWNHRHSTPDGRRLQFLRSPADQTVPDREALEARHDQ